MPHLTTYLGLADHSEQTLAESLRTVADGAAALPTFALPLPLRDGSPVGLAHADGRKATRRQRGNGRAGGGGSMANISRRLLIGATGAAAHAVGWPM